MKVMDEITFYVFLCDTFAEDMRVFCSVIKIKLFIVPNINMSGKRISTIFAYTIRDCSQQFKLIFGGYYWKYALKAITHDNFNEINNKLTVYLTERDCYTTIYFENKNNHDKWIPDFSSYDSDVS